MSFRALKPKSSSTMSFLVKMRHMCVWSIRKRIGTHSYMREMKYDVMS